MTKKTKQSKNWILAVLALVAFQVFMVINKTESEKPKWDLSRLEDAERARIVEYQKNNKYKIQNDGFFAICNRIIDGDTIEVLTKDKNKNIKIRLYGIDCPEKGQPGAAAATKFTSDLLSDQMLIIIPIKHDRYRRLVAKVITEDGLNISVELIRAGHAKWLKKYAPNDPELETASKKYKI